MLSTNINDYDHIEREKKVLDLYYCSSSVKKRAKRGERLARMIFMYT